MVVSGILSSAFDYAANEFGVSQDGERVPGWRGRTLSGPVTSSHGRQWLRVVVSPAQLARGMWWTGIAESSMVIGVPKPEVLNLLEWNVSDAGGDRARAELMTLLPGHVLSPTPELAAGTNVDPALWVEVGRALNVLASVPTYRDSTVPSAVDRLTHSFFGNRFPRSSPRWTTAHGDLHPGNLLVDPLGIVDWEGWGRAPEHFDLAMLYVHTLAAPDSRRSLVNVLGGQLYSDAALPALAFVAAKVLARSVSGDYLTLVDPVHRLLDNLTARSLGAGGTTMRLR